MMTSSLLLKAIVLLTVAHVSYSFSRFSSKLVTRSRPASASAKLFMSTGKSVAAEARAQGLFRSTPLVRSAPLSNLVGKEVYLKLDALQASGSFKDRGMAHLCQTLKDKQGVTKLISSSGGNAGLAVATIGQQLGMSVSVIVPETTKPLVVARLRALGAELTIHGENWNAADELARQRVKEDPTAAYISPYDNPLLWTGHSTLVDEIIEELGTTTIGAIVVSVGGGGLLCGVLEGLERQGLHATTVVAAETDGASSFGQAWEKGELVMLPAITSVATSLGAREVTPASLERAKEHQSRGGAFEAATCTDAEAVNACVQLSEDHRLLVEPACGAALAIAYSERLRNEYLKHIKGPIVLEVCGGSGVNVDLLSQWKAEFLD
jgi:L-serine/L-threonine ammonia-lyase